MGGSTALEGTSAELIDQACMSAEAIGADISAIVQGRAQMERVKAVQARDVGMTEQA